MMRIQASARQVVAIMGSGFCTAQVLRLSAIPLRGVPMRYQCAFPAFKPRNPERSIRINLFERWSACAAQETSCVNSRVVGSAEGHDRLRADKGRKPCVTGTGQNRRLFSRNRKSHFSLSRR